MGNDFIEGREKKDNHGDPKFNDKTENSSDGSVEITGTGPNKNEETFRFTTPPKPRTTEKDDLNGSKNHLHDIAYYSSPEYLSQFKGDKNDPVPIYDGPEVPPAGDDQMCNTPEYMQIPDDVPSRRSPSIDPVDLPVVTPNKVGRSGEENQAAPKEEGRGKGRTRTKPIRYRSPLVGPKSKLRGTNGGSKRKKSKA